VGGYHRPVEDPESYLKFAPKPKINQDIAPQRPAAGRKLSLWPLLLKGNFDIKSTYQ